MNSSLPAQSQEVQVELQKDQHQFEIAKIPNSANLENQKGWRAHFQKSRRDYMIFWVVVIFSALTFCCIAMFTQRAVKPRPSGRGYKAHLNWNFDFPAFVC